MDANQIAACEAGNKVLNKRIGNIRRTGAKLNDYIHDTLCLAVAHAHAFGDCTAVGRTVSAMPKTMRRSLAATWAGKYAPIVVSPTKDGGAKAHLRKERQEGDWLLVEGRANPFHSMPEAAKDPEFYTAEDCTSNIISLAGRLQKRLDDKLVAAQDVEAVTAKVAALKALAA